MSREDLNVDVLLGLYNPSDYLYPQLESLKLQRNVKVNLIVSLDSNNAQTFFYVSHIRKEFPEAIILTGPRKGAAANYHFMLNYSNNQFIAFCDQDDIWDTNHLITSVQILKRESKLPALVFCPTIKFPSRSQSPWPDNPSIELTSFLLENPAKGCTMVMNSLARELVKKTNLDNVIMHDWWSLLLVKMCGTVFFKHRADVHYRIHTMNTVGMPRKIDVFRFVQKMHESKIQAINQFQAASSFAIRMGLVQDASLYKLNNALKSKLWVFFLIQQRLRINQFEDLLFKGYLLLFAALSSFRRDKGTNQENGD